MSTEAHPITPSRAFFAVLGRDSYVTGRELPIFLAQVILQPLFLLFVFGKILTDLGYAQNGYAQVLFPGLVGLAAVLTGLQSTAFPLVLEFSYTMEIEDRLLAPLPVGLVALEKIVNASLRALVASVVMFPVGVLILGTIPWQSSNAPEVVAIVLLGCIVGSALGLVLGTFVPPNRINIMFALILTPLLFTGASQYPWPSLAHLRWFQVVTAVNPLTYVSEGLRGAMTPQVPHIHVWLCIVVLSAFVLAFSIVGMWGFFRRALG
ncbi:MAG TPA: ABC transporter permease [Actinomycetota bacterium]|nr:ABC transporter permease [Actinomycetota bacterium]